MKAVFPAALRRSIVPLCLIFLILGNFLNSQSGPDWWTDPGTAIWDGTTQENYAPVNVGQLKHVATKARAYLDGIYPGIDWDSAYSGSGISNPFSTDAFDPLLATQNYSPVNVGQLKAIAYGFYKVLEAKEHNVQGNISAYNGVWSSLDGFIVPWVLTPSSQNESPANVGQLKLVFSFNLSDADSDGIIDWWEVGKFGDPGLYGASDDVEPFPDGLTNIVEYLIGSDPNKGYVSNVTSPLEAFRP